MLACRFHRRGGTQRRLLPPLLLQITSRGADGRQKVETRRVYGEGESTYYYQLGRFAQDVKAMQGRDPARWAAARRLCGAAARLCWGPRPLQRAQLLLAWPAAVAAAPAASACRPAAPTPACLCPQEQARHAQGAGGG